MSGAQREMALEEWMARLPASHRANKEYAKLKEALDYPHEEISELQAENAKLKERVEQLEGCVENWKSLNDTKIELARNLYPELRNKLMLIREVVRKVAFIGLSKPQYLEALYEIKSILGDEE